jgi:microsomal dipeptidase-like Zn-dependent dipeptidase
MGAMIEFSAITCVGKFACRTAKEIAQAIQAVGPQRCVISTDFGQKGNPRPVEGLEMFANALIDAGLTPSDVRTMACTNPVRLLIGS